MKGSFDTGVCIAALVVAVCCGSAGASRGPSAPSGAINSAQAAPNRLRAFSLTDSRGAVVTDRTFRGEWLVGFFGVTNCADRSPAALVKLSQPPQVLRRRRKHHAMRVITPES